MSSFKVSVIVPAYNVEKYIGECLESIINQSYHNLEILVINDGSIDKTPEICEKYAGKDNRIKLFHHENKGVAEARNFAIEKATGEYLVFVDGDDFIDDYLIEKLVAQCYEKDIVYCDYYKYISKNNMEHISLIPFDLFNENVHVLAMPGPVCKLIKKELFVTNNIKFLRDKCFEDNAIMPLLSSLAKSYSYVKEPLYYYRQRIGSALNQDRYNEKWEDIFEVLEYLYMGFKYSNKYEKFQEELEFIYIEYLIHASGLRFINYNEGIKNIKKIHIIMKKKWPNWLNNKYYKKEKIKYKVMCALIYYKKIKLIKFLRRVI